MGIRGMMFGQKKAASRGTSLANSIPFARSDKIVNEFDHFDHVLVAGLWTSPNQLHILESHP